MHYLSGQGESLLGVSSKGVQIRALGVVQWSVLSPTAPKIRVCIPLSTEYLYEKTKINEKEAGVGPFKKK